MCVDEYQRMLILLIDAETDKIVVTQYTNGCFLLLFSKWEIYLRMMRYFCPTCVHTPGGGTPAAGHTVPGQCQTATSLPQRILPLSRHHMRITHSRS